MILYLIYFSGISMFFALFRLSVAEARPLSVSVALGLSIRFTGTYSIVVLQSQGERPKNKSPIGPISPNFQDLVPEIGEQRYIYM